MVFAYFFMNLYETIVENLQPAQGATVKIVAYNRSAEFGVRDCIVVVRMLIGVIQLKSPAPKLTKFGSGLVTLSVRKRCRHILTSKSGF